MAEAQLSQEEAGSSSDAPPHRSLEEYRGASKPQGRSCGHFTFPWDSHPHCLSCQLWGGKGQWRHLPCVSNKEYGFWCSQWQQSTCNKYSKALTAKISAPSKYQGGRTFVANHCYNAPLELLTFLDLQPIYFRGFSSTLE